MKVNELKAEIVRNGMTLEKFADKVGLARTTLWRRLSNPNELTLIEIRAMAEVLQLSKEKIVDIFFTEKVS